MKTWLGLDIGGANLKAALVSGQAASRAFAVWKRPEGLADAIGDLLGDFPGFDGVALTMTAELCDCFATKAEGVLAIIEAVRRAVGDQPVRVWGIDGVFHEMDDLRSSPRVAAASNWLALATVAARSIPSGEGLLIDIGSTTTDLIPLHDGRPKLSPIHDGRRCPTAWTDTDRLRMETLVYAGVRRTPLCALATHLDWQGGPIGLAAELFATTLDVYLTLDAIPPDPSDLDTADGRPATLDAARDRLARMVGADRDEFGPADANELARSFDGTLVNRLVGSVARLSAGPFRSTVVSGSGEFLARRVAGRVVQPGGSVISLAEAWGPVASVAACAFAVATLAEEGG